MGKIQRSIVLATALLTASAAPALAGQQVVTAPSGEDVIVTQSTSGVELRGKLVELSSTTLSLLVDGQRVDVPIDNVLRIDGRKDSLKNGTLIGLGVFGGLALLSCPELSSPGWCAYGVAINGVLGAALGAGIDALHKGRSPIYIKPAKSGGALQVKLRF